MALYNCEQVVKVIRDKAASPPHTDSSIVCQVAPICTPN